MQKCFEKKLAIIILNYNRSNDTIECLRSLSYSLNQKVFVLDNGSNYDELNTFIALLPTLNIDYSICNINDFSYQEKQLTVILSDENFGFAGGNNIIIKKIYSFFDYVMLLNNDTIVPPNTIEKMLSSIVKYKDVALTCDIRYFDCKSKLWNAGGKFKWYGDRKYFSQKKIDRLKAKNIKHIRVQFITGCALIVDCAYIKSNGFLTDKFFHGEEDYNFCYKLYKKRLPVGVDLSCVIYHKVGMSIVEKTNQYGFTNKEVLHYTNRIIDYKSFYGKIHWKIWKNFYLLLIFVKKFLSGRSFRSSFLLIKTINYYSKKYNEINKNLFLEIIGK